MTYLLSLYPGILRWGDSHDVYIYACRGRSFGDSSVSIEAESPLLAKFMLTKHRAFKLCHGRSRRAIKAARPIQHDETPDPLHPHHCSKVANLRGGFILRRCHSYTSGPVSHARRLSIIVHTF